MGAFDLSAYLWPETTQNRQPQGAIGLASEWADTCLAAYPVLGIGRESADGGKILAGVDNPSQYTPAIGRAGLALAGDGVTNTVAKGLYTQAGAVPYHGLPALSYFAVFELTAITSGFESAIFRATGTNVSQGFALGVFPSTKKIRALIQTNGTTGWSASYDVTDSRMAAGVLWGIGVSYVSGRRVIYSGPIGGAMVATVTTNITGTITDSAATSGPVYFGGSWHTAGTTPSFPGRIYTVSFWRGAKSRAEFESLFANPWQVFAPQPIPFILESSGAPTDVLTASSIIAAPAVVGTPAIGQSHALTASAVVLAPTVGTPDVSQRHVLSASGITASATVAQPSIAQRHTLTASTISASPTVVGTPALTEVAAGILSALPIVTAPAVVGTPALAQRHALVAGAIACGAPTFGPVSIKQQHALIAAGIALGAPVIGSPTLAEGGAAPLTQEQLDYMLLYIQENLVVPTAEQIAAAVIAAINLQTIPVNTVKMNGVLLVGDGSAGDKFRSHLV